MEHLAELGLTRDASGSLIVESQRAQRHGREAAPRERVGDGRTETERDRGRIAYSPYLRRLAGVTQVISPDLTASRMHSRASHTHKVALVARELAEAISRRALSDEGVARAIAAHGGLDVPACEAAGLAHDLGHPPFGHAGEQVLDRLLRKGGVTDGFEGNAQTFRIVTLLDDERIDRRGMDLTNVTLNAILKYPFRRPTQDADDFSTKKFGVYSSDVAAFERARTAMFSDDPASRRQSLEASIMDLADDIAYAIHDLEDFAAAGAIDMTRVLSDLNDALNAVRSGPKAFEESPATDPFTAETTRLRDYEGLFSDSDYVLALTNTRTLFTETFSAKSELDGVVLAQLKQLLSDRITSFFKNLVISDTPDYDDGPAVRLDKTDWHNMQALKVITRRYLIATPRMGTIQRAQTRTIERLFRGLTSWMRSAPDITSLPTGLQETLVLSDVRPPKKPVKKLSEAQLRAVADYICTMSDAEAALRADWFSGRVIPGMAADVATI
ncbi:deoxyguanosinetriphosphate triphosphohydrolase family protein [Microbacterium enclense]|uniref:dGTPase n=1 Tax=Microbacterium enclense TaxID=993073 RepID=A0A1G6IBH2_9MICO|nr:dNTP triphosphohydrolase [Microbacterium enclense]SDC03887.1 dGTPase [Microbacterium enclense]